MGVAGRFPRGDQAIYDKQIMWLTELDQWRWIRYPLCTDLLFVYLLSLWLCSPGCIFHADDGRTKPIPRKGSVEGFEPSDNKCLLRATDGKKKISTVVSWIPNTPVLEFKDLNLIEDGLYLYPVLWGVLVFFVSY